MWQRWSSFLESLGRIRLPIRFAPTGRAAGDPAAPDALGGRGWAAYSRSEPLFQLWGPLEGTPWEPFHCVPLFASVDAMNRREVGPTAARIVEEDLERLAAAEVGRTPAAPAPATSLGFVLPRHARPGAPPPPWLQPGTLCVLDLPGRAVVEAAAWLVSDGEAQPVCTFDHWPHARAVLPADALVAELLRWATTLAIARGRLASDAPPVWVCDAMRLGTRKGSPGDYDNRYYLDDSILPSPRVLREGGIGRVVYLGWSGGETSPDTPATGPQVPLPDLVEWFGELLAGGLEIHHSAVADPSFALRPFQAPARRPRFSRKGYRRSAAGGFGSEVPHPSSSSGSSG